VQAANRQDEHIGHHTYLASLNIERRVLSGSINTIPFSSLRQMPPCWKRAIDGQEFRAQIFPAQAGYSRSRPRGVGRSTGLQITLAPAEYVDSPADAAFDTADSPTLVFAHHICVLRRLVTSILFELHSP
jgi:hypothetical protein